MKKLCIVGGSSGLIGKDICSQLINEGYDVVGLDKDRSSLKDKNFKLFKVDLANEDSIISAFKDIDNDYDEVSLINCQGISDPYTGDIQELDLSTWNKYISVNLTSYMICSRELLKQFKNSKSIVNISSTRHLMSEKNTECYSATKGGINALTHSMANSLSSRNIKVNSISPGWIASEDSDLRDVDHSQHPANRVGYPRDISSICSFLINSKNSFITGQDFIVDGGMTKKMIYEH